MEKGMITIYNWKTFLFILAIYPCSLLSISFCLISSSCNFLPYLTLLLLSTLSSLLVFSFCLHSFLRLVMPGHCSFTDNQIANVSFQCCGLFSVWVVFGRISNCIYKKGENESINLLCFLIPACSISSKLFFPPSEIDFENRLGTNKINLIKLCQLESQDVQSPIIKTFLVLWSLWHLSYTWAPLGRQEGTFAWDSPLRHRLLPQLVLACMLLWLHILLSLSSLDPSNLLKSFIPVQPIFFLLLDHFNQSWDMIHKS